MKDRRSTEDYLKTIYILSQSQEVHACQIGKSMDLSRATVSVALKRLADEGYVRVDKENVICLTEQGLQVAQRTCDKYQLLKSFLMRLGVEEVNATQDACKMEHDLSSESYAALKQFMRSQNETKMGEWYQV